jgi:hypothetical protein
MPGGAKMLHPRLELTSRNHKHSVKAKLSKEVVCSLAISGLEDLQSTVTFHVFARGLHR